MLTFEKIRELERKEKGEEKLQKLPEEFTEELNDYLKKKEGITDQREMKNINSTVERLFELRENKIFDLVLYNVRTGMPVENLTKQEEDLFKILAEELKKFRHKLMERDFKEVGKDFKEEVKNNPRDLYRVTKSIPEIVGPDLKEYKLSENEIIDISALPKELNELLLKKGVIEKVE
jgi:DNA replication initiation complex subunit (GINS family)